MIPIIAHIPHSSTHIPGDLRSSFKLNDDDLQREILRLTDWYVDELFGCVKEIGGSVLVFPVTRLVLDPERFEDDEQEVMATNGMGVIYTRTSDGRQLRSTPTARQRRALLDRFYRPHHAALKQEVEACLNEFGRCLILDCHSFASHPLPCELDQDLSRPNICIGTDAFHTPRLLVDCIEQHFRALGWSVFRDKPYRGTLVPMAFYRKEKQLSSVMIELNRKLYMDEDIGQRHTSFQQVQEGIKEITSDLAGRF